MEMILLELVILPLLLLTLEVLLDQSLNFTETVHHQQTQIISDRLSLLEKVTLV